MSETQATSKAKKETVYTAVPMTDGRVVSFAGNRKTDKSMLEDEAGSVVGVRFDFVNGETRSLMFSELSGAVLARAQGHGIAQKAGDEYSGVKEPDDMVLAVDEIFTRLRNGDWAAQSTSTGESVNGASIVIKALVQHTGKSVEVIKAFLQGKLDKAKAADEKLSRQDLYNSFRAPGNPVAAIIKQLEEAKLAGNTKVDAGDLLAELGE